jgi:hypothetical protein
MPEPVIRCVFPDSNSTPPRGMVTISGSNLARASSVRIGSLQVAPANLVIANDECLACSWTTPSNTAPPAPGPVDVVVETPDGTATLPGGYTYVRLPPGLPSVNPWSGPTAGGTVLAIGGSYYDDAEEVTIGGARAEIISTSHTAIRCITPPGSGSNQPVRVTTPEGTVQSTTGYNYTGSAGPPVFDVQAPTFGPVVGGSMVRLGSTGPVSARGLSGATQVTFGGTEADFTVDYDALILARAPQGPAGLVTVTVTTPAGTGLAPEAFRWLEVC